MRINELAPPRAGVARYFNIKYEDAGMVSSVNVSISTDPSHGTIDALDVDPAHNGYATRLMLEAERFLQSKGVTSVVSPRTHGEAFMASLGYRDRRSDPRTGLPLFSKRL